MRRRDLLRSGAATTALLTPTLARGAEPGGDDGTTTLTPDSPSLTVERQARGNGEGVVELTLAAPGTDWASRDATSVTVDVTVGEGPTQQVVLYRGGRAATYRGFVGPVSPSGPVTPGRTTATVSLRPDLTWPPTFADPRVEVRDVSLAVVHRDDLAYPAVAHAPVLYGRDVMTHSDVPVASYHTRWAVDEGTRYACTVIYSNEDGGSGVVPAYLMGSYGRATDIETAVRFTVDGSGLRRESLRYHGCGHPQPHQEATCGVHEFKHFDGTFFGGHPVLRVASSNNTLSDDGEETSLRLQPAFLGPAPGPDERREAAMDRQPATYEVMDKEVTREHPESTTTPAPVFTYGDARQYLYVDIAGAVSGGSVAVDATFVDDPVFYASDYTGTGPESGPVPAVEGPPIPGGFPFYTGGRRRTVIKAPEGYDRPLEALRFRLGPQSPDASARITECSVFTLDESYAPTAPLFELSAPVELTAADWWARVEA